jgi:hypothetical protein
MRTPEMGRSQPETVVAGLPNRNAPTTGWRFNRCAAQPTPIPARRQHDQLGDPVAIGSSSPAPKRAIHPASRRQSLRRPCHLRGDALLHDAGTRCRGADPIRRTAETLNHRTAPDKLFLRRSLTRMAASTIHRRGVCLQHGPGPASAGREPHRPKDRRPERGAMVPRGGRGRWRRAARVPAPAPAHGRNAP